MTPHRLHLFGFDRYDTIDFPHWHEGSACLIQRPSIPRAWRGTQPSAMSVARRDVAIRTWSVLLAALGLFAALSLWACLRNPSRPSGWAACPIAAGSIPSGGPLPVPPDQKPCGVRVASREHVRCAQDSTGDEPYGV